MSESALRKLDVFLLTLFPLLAAWIVFTTRAGFLVSSLLFFGLPALWLSFRTPGRVVHSLVFALVFAVPVSIAADILGIVNQSWSVPESLFSARLLGLVPFEDIIWMFLYTYAPIIFYEHFLDKGRHRLVDKKMKYGILPIIVFTGAVLFVFRFFPDLLRIPYAYWWFGVVLVIVPTVTFLAFFPRLLSKYVKVASYFFFLTLLFELAGLEIGHWEFPGTEFIGWIELGPYRFPVEEFLFILSIGYIWMLSYYEFFDDDRK